MRYFICIVLLCVVLEKEIDGKYYGKYTPKQEYCSGKAKLEYELESHYKECEKIKPLIAATEIEVKWNRTLCAYSKYGVVEKRTHSFDADKLKDFLVERYNEKVKKFKKQLTECESRGIPGGLLYFMCINKRLEEACF